MAHFTKIRSHVLGKFWAKINVHFLFLPISSPLVPVITNLARTDFPKTKFYKINVLKGIKLFVLSDDSNSRLNVAKVMEAVLKNSCEWKVG